MKPRFPLSVERHFSYRARIIETGETLETESFKKLYYFTRSALRTEVFYPLDWEFSSVTAVFEYGYETNYEIKPGYFYSEWTTITDFGCLEVSREHEGFYSTDDESFHILKGVV